MRVVRERIRMELYIERVCYRESVCVCACERERQTNGSLLIIAYIILYPHKI